MKNKTVLVYLLAFAFFIAVFAGCASSQGLIPKDTETSFPLSPDLREVLYYASLAPNGHNTQPWKLGISADEKVLRLYIDSSRLLPAADPEGRESLISSKFAKRSVKLAGKQLENCEGFFIITGENSAKSYIEAGMNMEALWLAAAGEGISLQPMSQGLEEKVIRDSINMEFPESAPFQMIMRAGYVKNYGENNKIRRPLKDFVFLID